MSRPDMASSRYQGPSANSTQPNDGFPFHSVKGQAAVAVASFCPLLGVVEYADKHAPDSIKSVLKHEGFNKALIWRRDWCLYYIHTMEYGAILFISGQALDDYFKEMEEKLPGMGKQLSELQDLRRIGMKIEFSDLPEECNPLCLGSARSGEERKAWLSRLSSEPAFDIATSPLSLEQRKAFSDKLSLAVEIGKRQPSAHLLAHQARCIEQLQTLQQYLGLLPHLTSYSPILIAVDCEAYEFDQRCITEVGIAVLDTSQLQNVAAGEIGENLHQYITSRHIRVSEYQHLVNKRHVIGQPDRFRFGRSEFLRKHNVAKELKNYFEYLRGQQYPTLEQAVAMDVAPKRDIIVVGHSLQSDVQYCARVGFNLADDQLVTWSVDTQDLWRAYSGDTCGRKLEAMLDEFDLEAWNAHNAGNDATYTLRALLAICHAAASKRPVQRLIPQQVIIVKDNDEGKA